MGQIVDEVVLFTQHSGLLRCQDCGYMDGIEAIVMNRSQLEALLSTQCQRERG